MKKTISIILTAVLLCSCLSACGSSQLPAAGSGDKITVVTTIFPIYDWVRTIAGDSTDSLDITWLLNSGVDLHSYQPTVEDILRISNCDIFIYVGGESDAWVSDALSESVNPDMTVISLLDTLGDAAKEEQLLEGMEPEDEEPDDEGQEYDEHVWLSLRNAEALTEAIARALAAKDPSHEEQYTENHAAYRQKLEALDVRYTEAVSKAPLHTVLFGDRFPFRYLMDDYGLDCYAAFSGCSAETEASFETVVFLAGKLDELGLPAVLILDGGDGKIARTIIESTKSKDQQILTMDSMQGVVEPETADYLSIMEQNLAVLETALGLEGN